MRARAGSVRCWASILAGLQRFSSGGLVGTWVVLRERRSSRRFTTFRDANCSRRIAAHVASFRENLERPWTPCFTAFRPYTGKSLARRNLELSKLPRDVSSWAGRALLGISVQASHISAYFGRADFKEKGLFVYSGCAVALVVSYSFLWTTWTPLSMPMCSDS